MQIINGGIYRAGQVFYLPLFENVDNNGKIMFYCIIGHNISELFDANDYCLVEPKKNWIYSGIVSNVQYKQALDSFKNSIKSRKMVI